MGVGTDARGGWARWGYSYPFVGTGPRVVCVWLGARCRSMHTTTSYSPVNIALPLGEAQILQKPLLRTGSKGKGMFQKSPFRGLLGCAERKGSEGGCVHEQASMVGGCPGLTSTDTPGDAWRAVELFSEWWQGGWSAYVPTPVGQWMRAASRGADS